MTLQKLPILLWICFLPVLLKAQVSRVTPPVNAKKVILEGIELHDHENYNDAIAKYDQVNKNDDSYIRAQIEKANSLFALKKYDECLKIGQDILKRKEVDEFASVYIICGNALDELNREEESINMFELGLKKYPMNYLLLYNEGLVYRKQKKNQQAVDCFKKAIYNNPYHYSSHLQLGVIASEEGKLAESIFSFLTCLILNPKIEKSKDIVGYLDVLVSKKYEDKNTGVVFSDKGDDFTEVETLLRSQVALNPKYKAESSLSFPVIKQTHLLLSQLANHTSESGFYEKNYLPFFREAFKSGNFEGLSYFMLLSSDNEKAIAAIKKNESKLKKFQIWGDDNFQKYFCKREIIRDDKVVNTFFWYNSNKNLYLIGNLVDNKIDGITEMYNSDGYMSAVGKANMGKLEGLWIFKYENGMTSTEKNFTDDKLNGSYKAYYDNGVLQSDLNYKMDSLDGEGKYYFPNGVMSYDLMYSNNKDNGFFKSYYNSGVLKTELNYVNDQKEGIEKDYYPNGDKSSEVNFTKDVKNGLATFYFHNGSVKVKQNYVDGKLDGDYIEYYENGQIKAEGKLKNNEVIGNYKEYFEDGHKKSEFNYDLDGNQNGTIKYFSKEGWQTTEVTNARGKMNYIKYFDKNGVVYYESKMKENTVIELHREDQTVFAKGKFANSDRVGDWTFYYRNGNIKEKCFYKDGELSGPYTTYFQNGILKDTSTYKSGNKDGLYQLFYPNGQLKREGWMDDDDQEGQWYNYQINGMISRTYYMQNDALKGDDEYYDAFGKLNEVVHTKNNFENYYARFDTAGNEIYRFYYEQGNTQRKFQIPGSKSEENFAFKDGLLNGPCYKKQENGVKSFEGTYERDQKNGQFLWRNVLDSISYRETYKDGDIDGNLYIYFLNGKMSKNFKYKNDLLEGVYTRFYPSGTKFYEINYKEDLEDGPEKYYSPSGELFLIVMYNEGDMLYYIKNNKEGKLADTTYVTAAKMTIEANYKNGTKAMSYELENGEGNGHFIVYNNEGKIVYQSTEKNDIVEGEKIMNYSSGNIYSKEQYENGDLNGECIYYWENGNVMVKSNYKYDDLYGETTIYDINGKLKETRMYYDNELISITKK